MPIPRVIRKQAAAARANLSGDRQRVYVMCERCGLMFEVRIGAPGPVGGTTAAELAVKQARELLVQHLNSNRCERERARRARS